MLWRSILTLIFCVTLVKVNAQEVNATTGGQAETIEHTDLTPSGAYELIQTHQNDTNFIILDFRTQAMYDEAHIENAQVYDVFSEGFDAWISGFDKQKTYLLYCTRGHRSGIALEKMKQLRFKNLYHLSQGITEWKNQGFKTINKNQ